MMTLDMKSWENKKVQGLAYGMLATMFLSFEVILTKVLVSKLDSSVVTLGVASVIGFIILPLVIFVKKYSVVKIGADNLKWIFIIGILGAGIANYLAVVGIKLLPLSESAFLLQFEAVFAALVAYIWLKEKMSREQLFGTGIMIVGAYILTGIASIGLSPGFIFILLATSLFGLTDIMAKKIAKNIPMEMVIGLRFMIGSLVLLVMGYNQLERFFHLSIQQILLIFIAAGCLFLFVTFLYKSITYLPQAIGTLFLIPGLVFSALVGVVIFGEAFNLTKSLGAILILIGLVIGTGILPLW